MDKEKGKRREERKWLTNFGIVFREETDYFFKAISSASTSWRKSFSILMRSDT